MQTFKIGDKVVIKSDENTHGTVVGIWIDEDGHKKFNVRYSESSGVIHENWFGSLGIEHRE